MEALIALLIFIIIVIVAALIYIAVAWLRSRVRTVPQGHVAVIHWMSRLSRVVGPGPYFLRPFETEKTKIMIRQREATIGIPNVFTHGGLPVTVNLRYTYRLDLQKMESDEYDYSERERIEQQSTIFKLLLQEIVRNLESPASEEKSARRVDIQSLFSPFIGAKGVALRAQLEQGARESLAKHGIILTDSPVAIGGLQLPESIVNAYMSLLSSDFDSTAKSDFIERVRSAAPNMSDAGLVQLFNVIQNPSAELHTIFTNGYVQPDIYIQKNDLGVRQPAPPPAPLPSAPRTRSQAPPNAAEPVAHEDPGKGQGLPLTEDTMQMLKSDSDT